MKLSDYVIKFLHDNYDVDTIFTLSGGGCIHLIDSLGKSENVNYIATQHVCSLTEKTELIPGTHRYTASLIRILPNVVRTQKKCPGLLNYFTYRKQFLPLQF